MEQPIDKNQYCEKYTQVLKALEDTLVALKDKNTPLYKKQMEFLQKFKTDLIALKSEINNLDANNFAQLIYLQYSWQALQDSVQDQLNELDANANPYDPQEQFAKKFLSQVLDKIKQAFDFNLMAAELYKLAQEQLIFEVFNSTQVEIRQLTSAKPKCFISYAWGITEHEQLAAQLAAHLILLGFDAWFDKRSNLAGAHIDYYVANLNKADYVIVLGSKKLMAKYQAGQALYEAEQAKHQQLNFERSATINRNYIINEELHQIFTKRSKSPSCVIPLLLDGMLSECLPPDFQVIVPIHFMEYRNTYFYCAKLFELLTALLPHEAVKTLAVLKQTDLKQKLKLLANYVQTDDWQNTLAQYQQDKLKAQSEPFNVVKQVV